MSIAEAGAAVAHRKLYAALVRKKLWFLLGSLAFLVFLFLFDLGTGPSGLRLSEILSALNPLASCPEGVRVIVLQLRLPVAVMAVMVGASLGTAGSQMQTILNNPLASPYTLGVSAAASFGAALEIVTGWLPLPIGRDYAVPLSAFLFSLLSSLLILVFAKARRGGSHTLILAGIALGFLFSSLVSFMEFTAKENQLAVIVFWMFGSLQGATWTRALLVGFILLGVLIFLLAEAWNLTALRLGDAKARSMGINVGRLRFKVSILIALVTAIPVCFTGTIGFVGLVAPHFARHFVGEDQRFYTGASALWGGILLSFASILSKTLIPGAVFPIGIATTFIGLPFLIAIIMKRRTS
ncbi:MAG: FecCD family ABC transporter permease [Chthoniobacteraceae bacterium]